MAIQILDFEEPIIELENKIIELRDLQQSNHHNYKPEIRRLHKRLNRLRKDTLSKLTSWQRIQWARHPDRPYTMDYIENMTQGFFELQGDRKFASGKSIVGGFATFEEQTVMILGHQKGRGTKEKMERNFGMPQPEGNRKALRLMKLAEKFDKPIITLLDTPGAYPGIEAEERGQAESIAVNLFEMASLKVPIISVVIGEGGSGGALALGVGNRVMMLENSVYSVISPEGCAAILWNDCEKIEQAAEALSLTASHLEKFGVIDEVVREPVGGAHRDPKLAASILRRALRRELKKLDILTAQELVDQRRKKFRVMGEWIGK